MNRIKECIEKINSIIHQYYEGAITEEECYNAIFAALNDSVKSND